MDNIKKLFYCNYKQTENWRIPSLITTSKGTLIAAIDQGHGPDYGKIQIALRRSTDQGRIWGDLQTLTDLPGGIAGEEQCFAYNIDISMVCDRDTGRIFLFTDMFPESKGMVDKSLLEHANGYYREGGKSYLILRNYTGTLHEKSYTAFYTVRENGTVYDEKGQPTTYHLPDYGDGTLYRDGLPVGNIFVYTGENAAPLNVVPTSYFWMFYSDDDGLTWSGPVDLNPQIKPDDLMILLVGPGRGLQLESGRLLVNVYGDNGAIGAIFSDDHGLTWRLGNLSRFPGTSGSETQSVEVRQPGGKTAVKMFCRAQGQPYVTVCTSYDGGESFTQAYFDEALLNPNCQISVIRYPYVVAGYPDRPGYLFSGCHSSKRRINGTVQIGIYLEETDRFEWVSSKLIAEAAFMYSCLTVIEENRVGLLYEVNTWDTSYQMLRISDFIIPGID